MGIVELRIRRLDQCIETPAAIQPTSATAGTWQPGQAYSVGATQTQFFGLWIVLSLKQPAHTSLVDGRGIACSSHSKSKLQFHCELMSISPCLHSPACRRPDRELRHSSREPESGSLDQTELRLLAEAPALCHPRSAVATVRTRFLGTLATKKRSSFRVVLQPCPFT